MSVVATDEQLRTAAEKAKIEKTDAFDLYLRACRAAPPGREEEYENWAWEALVERLGGEPERSAV